MEYDTDGNLFRITYLNEDGKPQNSIDGFAYQDIKYDALGRKSEVTYRNAAGEPVSWVDGLFRKVYVYDEAGTAPLYAEFLDKTGNLLRRE